MTSLRESLSYEPVELGFGTSGLRGLVTDMTDLECYINSAGFLRFLQDTSQIKAGDTVYLAGDLRNSTPRILAAVVHAIEDRGYSVGYGGLIPTPAIAHFALHHNAASIMVTGSHIPADRNGIKFYKVGGEILKSDEAAIKEAVAAERERLYIQPSVESIFVDDGSISNKTNQLPVVISDISDTYFTRYSETFPNFLLQGKKIVVYQHSAVGRDLLAQLLVTLGAEVVTVGRSEVFVSIDTENVTPTDQAYFKSIAAENEGVFAIVSTDGDSDRPFVIDENGTFHRGDELGAVVAAWLKVDFVAIPVSSNDAVDQFLKDNDIAYVHTKIGSPYVIEAMSAATLEGKKRVAGWEVNGGFLLGSDFDVYNSQLSTLATRDAFFPIIAALASACERSVSISELFSQLPSRFTQAGLIDNFSVDTSKKIVQTIQADSPENRTLLSVYFTDEDGFDEIIAINVLDGIRIYFANGDIAHLRPSGNAPQMRVYSVASSQQRADEIVELGIREDGILTRLAAEFQS